MVRLPQLLLTLCVVAVVLSVAALDSPTQVHIALAGLDKDGNSNSMAVSWNTVNQTPSSTVKYGTTSGQYISSSVGKSSAYWESYNHHVVLGELTPNTVYYYIVGDDEQGWSEELTFRSAPLTSELRGNFSFIVYGDLGVYNGDPTKDYIEKVCYPILDLTPDFIILRLEWCTVVR